MANSNLTSSLSKRDRKRFSRQIILPNVGVEGQQRLKKARILLVGVGGLGSPIALYLASAGVGTLGIVEFDTVDESNLQRQVLYTEHDVGAAKLGSAAKRLRAINSELVIEGFDCALNHKNAEEIIGQYDLVIDGTDNFETRYIVNDACVLAGKPLIFGSIYRFEGQVSVLAGESGPCYRCLYPEPPPSEYAPSCSEGGVFGVLPGVIGGLQATEAIKWVTGLGQSLRGRLLTYDALKLEFSEYDIAWDIACEICGENPTYKDLSHFQRSQIQGYCHVSGANQTFGDHTALKDEISAKELNQLMAGKDLQLVDVRSKEEFELQKIDGATLRKLDGDDLDVSGLALDKTTVCYCKSGKRSARAIQILKAFGFSKVLSLQGGIESWYKEVLGEECIY